MRYGIFFALILVAIGFKKFYHGKNSSTPKNRVLAEIATHLPANGLTDNLNSRIDSSPTAKPLQSLTANANTVANFSPLPNSATASETKLSKGYQPSESNPLDWRSPLKNFPLADTFSYQGRGMEADYAIDSLLNARVNVYLQRYRPETGVILIADLKTGQLLALGERQDSVISNKPHLAFEAGYPAASLIKILTATTALQCNSKYLQDSIPQVGSFHTLYKKQLMIDRPGRYAKITLAEAFAKSVNPAFGIMGLNVGPLALRKQASILGFNKINIPGIAESRIEIPDSGFSLAEAACGFTPKTTITPWHALEIARGAGDDGRLRNCTFVHKVVDLSTQKPMIIPTELGELFLSAENLPKLQALMQATVEMGTARKGFRRTLKAKELEKIEAGGKTGSLDGKETPGRFDWFIGYVKLKDQPSRGLAFSVMLVHREYSTIHASQLTALLIKDWLNAIQKARKAEQNYRAV